MCDVLRFVLKKQHVICGFLICTTVYADIHWNSHLYDTCTYSTCFGKCSKNSFQIANIYNCLRGSHGNVHLIVNAFLKTANNKNKTLVVPSKY